MIMRRARSADDLWPRVASFDLRFGKFLIVMEITEGGSNLHVDVTKLHNAKQGIESGRTISERRVSVLYLEVKARTAPILIVATLY